jgi:DNA-binding NarL/FixJ family response regulator
MIHILVAEDIPSLAEAMKRKLQLRPDFKLEAICSNGKEVIEYLEKDSNIDLILMDIKMPEMDGIQATELINNRWPQIKIVMCTIFDDDEHIFNAILAGACGYLMKDEKPEKLYRSIYECLEGGAPMSPFIARRSLDLIKRSTAPQTNSTEDFNLTKREIEILEQLSKGLSYADIADNLFISQGTVRKHIENTYRKLKVGNKVEAIRVAEKNRIIS